jgi:hypothetical protein
MTKTKWGLAMIVLAGATINVRALEVSRQSDNQQLDKAVRVKLDGIKACLEQTAHQDQPQHVDLEVSIKAQDGRGVVSYGRVVPALASDSMETYLCVVEAFVDTTLPRPYKDETVTLRYPLVLRATGAR